LARRRLTSFGIRFQQGERRERKRGDHSDWGNQRFGFVSKFCEDSLILTHYCFSLLVILFRLSATLRQGTIKRLVCLKRFRLTKRYEGFLKVTKQDVVAADTEECCIRLASFRPDIITFL
jgi:hypothetical protein